MSKKFYLLLLIVFLGLIGCNGPEKSELEKALDEENYTNYEVKMSMTVSINGESTSNESTMKIDGDKLYIATSSYGLAMETYGLLKNNKYATAVRIDSIGEWIFEEMNLDEVSTDALSDYVASDFTKDENDYYVLNEEKTTSYIEDLLAEFEYGIVEVTVNSFFMKFNIKDGKIDTMIYEFSFTVEGMEFEMSCEAEYTEYGQVSITIPSDVLELFNR